MSLEKGNTFSFWQVLTGISIFHLLVMLSLVGTMMLYYARRFLFPLKGRGTRAILLAGIVFLLPCLSASTQAPSVPCVIHLVMYCASSHAACMVYLFRVAQLVLRHEVAQELEFRTSPRISTAIERTRSCLRHPRVMSFMHFKWAVLGISIYGLCVGVVMLIVALTSPIEDFCLTSPLYTYSDIVLAIILLPPFGYMWFKLRKFPSDARHIAQEFRAMAVAIFVALFTCTVLNEVTQLTYVWTALYMLDAVGLSLMASSMWFPLILSFEYTRKLAEKQRKSNTNNTHVPSSTKRGSNSLSVGSTTTSSLTYTTSFEELLKNEDFREAFLVHLKREFSAESLIFWQSCQEFKAKGERPAEEMIRDVQELMDLYLTKGAPYQLNTSAESIASTEEAFQHAKATSSCFLPVFDGILHEVLDLMKSDPLPRFLLTPAARDFVLVEEKGPVAEKVSAEAGSPGGDKVSAGEEKAWIVVVEKENAAAAISSRPSREARGEPPTRASPVEIREVAAKESVES